MAVRPKVFCLGFHKTGTTSIYAALRQLGYRVCGPIGLDRTVDDLRENGAKLCIETIKDFDAAEDMPWPLYFRELDAAYPGSKFILTIRDPENWHRSAEKHFGEGKSVLQSLTYGVDAAAPLGNRDQWISVYMAHNQAVIDHFRDRPGDLLVLDIAKDFDWVPICAHLGREIPDCDFPRRNTAAIRKGLFYRLKRKFYLMIGRTPHAEQLG